MQLDQTLHRLHPASSNPSNIWLSPCVNRPGKCPGWYCFDVLKKKKKHWDLRSVLFVSCCAYCMLCRHHPLLKSNGIFPASENISHTDNLLLCLHVLKRELWTMPAHNSPEFKWENVFSYTATSAVSCSCPRASPLDLSFSVPAQSTLTVSVIVASGSASYSRYFNPQKFPSQSTYVISLAYSDSSLGPPTSWTSPENLQWRALRKNPDEMPEPHVQLL